MLEVLQSTEPNWSHGLATEQKTETQYRCFQWPDFLVTQYMLFFTQHMF